MSSVPPTVATSASSALSGEPRDAEPRLALPPEERLRVNEIFFSIQGESTRAGRPCVFVRLTGCQMRCRWCDTAYAFHAGVWKTVDEVLAEVTAFDCPLVEVTGGEPLLQPGALTLMERLADQGHEVMLETGGGLDISPVDPRVRRILDIKCPGSGEAEANRWENLELLGPDDEVKLVIASEDDYRWAREVILSRRLAERCPVSLSPVWDEVAPADLAAWVLRDRLPVRLQLQIHKVLWGDRPGV